MLAYRAEEQQGHPAWITCSTRMTLAAVSGGVGVAVVCALYA